MNVLAAILHSYVIVAAEICPFAASFSTSDAARTERNFTIVFRIRHLYSQMFMVNEPLEKTSSTIMHYNATHHATFCSTNVTSIKEHAKL